MPVADPNDPFGNGTQGVRPAWTPGAGPNNPVSSQIGTWGGYIPQPNPVTPQGAIDAANAYRTQVSNPQATVQPWGTVSPPTDMSPYAAPGTFPSGPPTTPDPYQLPQLSQQLEGFLGQPSNAQTFFDANKGGLSDPTPSKQYWNGVSGKFNAPGMTNNAQTAFNQFEQDRPNLAATPGLDPYYADAEARTSGNLNKQFAAKGAYGSSVDSGTVAGAVGGLEADRAKNEASYALARQNAITGFDSAAAGAGAGADASSRGIAQTGLSYLLGGSQVADSATQGELSRVLAGNQMATGADAANLARTGLSANIAGMTDTQRSSRENSMLSNLLTLGNDVSGNVGGAYADLNANDITLLNSIQGGSISKADAAAKAQEAVQQGNYQLAAMIMKVAGVAGQPGAPAAGGASAGAAP